MRPLLAALAVLALAGPAAAQAPEPPPASSAVDVDRLPLNLNRIQRELKHATDLEQREGLNLRYVIQIYGSAPPIDLFGEDANLATGPVPYGAPTHQEILNHITPLPFRTPAADISALVRWLSERGKKKD